MIMTLGLFASVSFAVRTYSASMYRFICIWKAFRYWSTLPLKGHLFMSLIVVGPRMGNGTPY